MATRAAVTYLLMIALSACSTVQTSSPSPEVGIDGAACVGRTIQSAPGLAETSNEALVRQARLATDKGGVCAARVFAVTEPTVLYRVFDSADRYSKFGRWWSLSRPSGTREEYRAAYAICPEWSNLDRVVSCEVKPGSVIVIGTTQSAACKDGTMYSKTENSQVYVPNDSRIGINHVGACSEEMVWP